MVARSSSGSEETLRAFVAIELPLPLREDLCDKVRRAGSNIPNQAIRWVKPSKIHLTLRFLGDTQEALLPEIGEKLKTVVSSLDAFTLTTSELGCFPSPGRPRVIWVGLTGDLEKLDILNRLVEEAVVEFGWKPENRRFKPHLTVGRVKESHKVVEANLPYGDILIDQTFSVDAISLIESKLESSGAIYTPRIRFTLGEP